MPGHGEAARPAVCQTSGGAQVAAATFPCFLEVLGTPGEYVPLVQDGVRRPVNLEYFWDTTITATPAAFEILIEGVEPGQPQPTANAA